MGTAAISGSRRDCRAGKLSGHYLRIPGAVNHIDRAGLGVPEWALRLRRRRCLSLILGQRFVEPLFDFSLDLP